jgi:hypothetical protein
LLNAYNSSDLLNTFINFIKHFIRKLERKGKIEYDSLWRNRLCKNILSFQSIYQTIESYLSEVKMREASSLAFLDKIIQIYNQNTQSIMKAEMVDICKRIGNSIGRYCREKEDKGILYAIRNCRNRIDFLKVLSESQFRTEVSFGEEFFKELPDNSHWEEYKSLVSIFAMNSFLFNPSKSKTQPTKS